jgi:hypothetical protein
MESDPISEMLSSVWNTNVMDEINQCSNAKKFRPSKESENPLRVHQIAAI